MVTTMPPMMREQARGAYDHVVGSVLDQGQDAPLRLALEKEGVSNIMHLLIMPEATIDVMTYDVPGDGTKAATADIPYSSPKCGHLRHSSLMPSTALMLKE